MTKRALAVAAGVSVVAGAVAAVRPLLPQDDPPPANLEAKLDPVDIRPGVPLDEFTAQETFLTASAGGADGGRELAAITSAPRAVRRLLVALAPAAARAQVPTPEGEGGAPAAPDDGGEAPPAGEPMTSTDEGTTTAPDGGTATTPGPDEGDDDPTTTTEEPSPVEVPPEVEDRCAERASPPVAADPAATAPGAATPPTPAPGCAPLITAADEDSTLPELREQTEAVVGRINEEYVVGRVCADVVTSAGCSLTAGAGSTPLMQTLVGGAPDEGPVPGVPTTSEGVPKSATPREAQRLKLALVRLALRQLRNTKSIAGPGGKRRPLGVLVDYRVRLCGFTGRRAHVFWSIFDTGRPPRLPYLWVHNRLANVIRQRATGCEEVSPTFWVPMPAVRGRFTIVLSVVDEDGNARGRARSAPFRS